MFCRKNFKFSSTLSHHLIFRDYKLLLVSLLIVYILWIGTQILIYTKKGFPTLLIHAQLIKSTQNLNKSQHNYSAKIIKLEQICTEKSRTQMTQFTITKGSYNCKRNKIQIKLRNINKRRKTQHQVQSQSRSKTKNWSAIHYYHIITSIIPVMY